MNICKGIGLIASIASLLLPSSTWAAEHYVDLNSPNPTAPYSTWDTAAANIQDAVDAAAEDDTVWVTNGTYALTAEITVTNNIIIQSVNGADVTIVDGQARTRCFNLGEQACTLEGFTIQNGYTTEDGAGVYCASAAPMISHCTIRKNTANKSRGGGIYNGTVNHCTVINNSATDHGGGMDGSTANHCLVIGNSSNEGNGGGIYGGTVDHCRIIGNSANQGGGISSADANNCEISHNRAEGSGGGVYDYYSENKILLRHCTITHNSAGESGGGLNRGSLFNCIAWNNSAARGYDNLGKSVSATYTCSPDVTHGVDGNITNTPLLTAGAHIAYNSPCVGAGTTNTINATGTDLDGDPWKAPPSMGCDEPGEATMQLKVEPINLPSRAYVGESISLYVHLMGPVSSLVIDFDDGTTIMDSPWLTHQWDAEGDYEVVFSAYRFGVPDATSITQQVHVVTLEAEAIHVAPEGNDSNTGASWTEAKATIQAGVDAQLLEGGLVIVSNGTYHLTQQVTAANEVIIRSLGGPEETIVDGGVSNRCFNLRGACRLEGFTIQNGYNGSEYKSYSNDHLGGGVYCLDNTASLINCTLRDNYAHSGGGLAGGRAEHCRFMGNSAFNGGGIYGGSADHCIFEGNEAAGSGGGMYGSEKLYREEMGWSATANRCTFINNKAFGTFSYPWVTSHGGGGMAYGSATNSLFAGNFAKDIGGGAVGSAVQNCVFTGNSAYQGGGIGAYFAGEWGDSAPSLAVHCTFTGNHSKTTGGGLFMTPAVNCIAWYNTADGGEENISPQYIEPWWTSYYIRHTSTPDIIHGSNLIYGNSTNAPLLISSSHIASNSPCVGAGTSLMHGIDIDGEDWNHPPSMGCDEPTGAAEGPMQLHILGLPARMTIHHEVNLSMVIFGACSEFSYDLGDGTVSNNLAFKHQWEIPGHYDVVLTAFNSAYPDGLSVTQQVEVVSAEDAAIYVALDGNDLNAGNSWATAKATIQAGIDAQMIPGGTVWVTNGTYHLTEYIDVAKPIIVQSVHGAETTWVDGGHSNRCFNLGSSACTLRGLTIANGSTMNYSGPSDEYGGGIACYSLTPVVESCVILSNAADTGGGMSGGTAIRCVFEDNVAYHRGGGMSDGTAIHCVFEGNMAEYDGGGMAYGDASQCVFMENSARDEGGGAYECSAINCTFTRNSAKNGGGMAGPYDWPSSALHSTFTGNHAEEEGGGLYKIPATNCIVWHNTAALNGDNLNSIQGIASTCSPDVAHGANGNITNAPLFVDATAGDYRLQSNSPCINWGADEYVTFTMDLDGNPRVVGAHVDMGAYEFQTDLGDDANGNGLSDEWERMYFGYPVLPTDNPDGDAAPNGDEYVAGTNPTNAASYFAVTNVALSAEGFVVQWESQEGRSYSVWWSDALTNAFQALATDLPYPISSYTDAVHTVEGTSFYQLEVELND